MGSFYVLPPLIAKFRISTHKKAGTAMFVYLSVIVLKFLHAGNKCLNAFD